ncbi:hypothetical protein INR49_008805, partial [Caranx melampygus]
CVCVLLPSVVPGGPPQTLRREETAEGAGPGLVGAGLNRISFQAPLVWLIDSRATKFVVFIMSLSSSDITELMELWVELNLTGADHNLSHVEAVVCSGGVSHAAFLHALSVLYVFIFLVGVVSNGLVVWVNLRSDGDHHETHLYVLHWPWPT